jgi:MFS superfamily sulfate permease-like transporter
MNFSFLKNISPMYLYLVSIISFVLANVTREINVTLYYALLLLGLVFFVLGLLRRMQSK